MTEVLFFIAGIGAIAGAIGVVRIGNPFYSVLALVFHLLSLAALFLLLRAQFVAAFGTPGQIGELLLTKFLLPFEVASFLLLIAAVGAVVLARRRGGIVEQAEGTPLDRPRPL